MSQHFCEYAAHTNGRLAFRRAAHWLSRNGGAGGIAKTRWKAWRSIRS